MALMMAAVPLWMGYQNYPSNDRSDRYVARDYAYNLLNSLNKMPCCLPMAIMIRFHSGISRKLKACGPMFG